MHLIVQLVGFKSWYPRRSYLAASSGGSGGAGASSWSLKSTCSTSL